MRKFDALHGFIHFTDLEAELIEHPLFQRLHHIHQLGMSYKIYPGATHTRFEHSLGTMYLADKIFNQIGLDEQRDYWAAVVRFAALCHDLGHLPFSHVAEKQLLGFSGHEKWTMKLIESEHLRPLWEKVQSKWPENPVCEHVIKLALGYEKLSELRPDLTWTPIEKVYAEIVTGDFFGADRIDYLLRDAKATGLNYGMIDYAQLIEMMHIAEDEQNNLRLVVEENGIESCEALLLARHFMQSRVYQHPSVKAIGFHLSRFMNLLYGDRGDLESVTDYAAMTEHQILCAIEDAQKNPSAPGHFDASCLMNKQMRFQAIHLSDQMDEKQLLLYQVSQKVPDQMIQWELSSQKKKSPEIHLPVASRNNSLKPLPYTPQVNIPMGKKSWLFLSPEYQFQV